MLSDKQAKAILVLYWSAMRLNWQQGHEAPAYEENPYQHLTKEQLYNDSPEVQRQIDGLVQMIKDIVSEAS